MNIEYPISNIKNFKIRYSVFDIRYSLISHYLTFDLFNNLHGLCNDFPARHQAYEV